MADSPRIVRYVTADGNIAQQGVVLRLMSDGTITWDAPEAEPEANPS